MNNVFKKKQKWNEGMYSRFPTKQVYENRNFLVRFIEQQRVKTVLGFSEIKESDKVIEVGCEAGYLLKQLLVAKEIVGLDIAENALGDAKKSIQSDKVKFICADASDIPFRDSYFDKVICSQTLEHLSNPEKVIAEMFRIVKPGGAVIVSVPNERVLIILKKFFVKIGLFNLLFPNLEPRGSSWHIRVFSKREICQLLKKYFIIQRFKYVPVSFIGPEMVIQCSPKQKL